MKWPWILQSVNSTEHAKAKDKIAATPEWPPDSCALCTHEHTEPVLSTCTSTELVLMLQYRRSYTLVNFIFFHWYCSLSNKCGIHKLAWKAMLQVNLQFIYTGHGAPLLGQRPAQAVVAQVSAGGHAITCKSDGSIRCLLRRSLRADWAHLVERATHRPRHGLR
jgi:hypothetical protein